MSKKLILFGAGASYGSDDYGTPPIGSKLFQELKKFDPEGWGKISEELSYLFKNDFEGGMVKLSQEFPHYISVLQRIMAAYFFKFFPTNNNLYVKLAHRIKNTNWKGSLATLNYERLLELSLMELNIPPSQVELCLPHGCCHIFCESVRASSANVTFNGMSVSTNGNINAIYSPQEFYYRIKNDAFPPVMSYFEPNKNTTSGKNFIDFHRKRFNSLVNEATIIVIIGVRVRENDKHIWEPLSQTSAKLIYCSGVNAAKEYKEWKLKYREKKEDIILEGYFKDSFEQLCNELCL